MLSALTIVLDVLSRGAGPRRRLRLHFPHDPARLVPRAHNAAVSEVPNHHAHSGVLVRGEAFEALKPGEVLEVFGFGHGRH
jgi:hypothetical protein